ncbi:MAG: FAD-dependent oxidoreductase [Balneolaceae bacterium]
MEPDAYAGIIGAGVAGTALANALTDLGKQILLVDPLIGSESVGMPAALVNPATGRRARMSWRSKECLSLLENRLESVAQETGRTDLWSQSGVLRPAVSEDLAKNFRESVTSYNWPRGWIEWLEPGELRRRNAEVNSEFGGLWLSPAFTIFAGRYLQATHRLLASKGVETFPQETAWRYDSRSGCYELLLEGGQVRRVEHLVVAAGYRTSTMADWEEILPLHPVKGQLVRYRTERLLKWNHAVSAMGYLLKTGEKEFLAGSTYEHRFSGLETTRKALERINEKVNVMLPGLKGNFYSVEQLSGARVTLPNRLPVIGSHPEKKRLYIFSALGSRGFLYSEYLASLLAGHMIRGEAIPDIVGTNHDSRSTL